ncbi:hypothetical protein TTHERM_01354250 (macronuclear) [Tetrahymena thermophila SB210]|uniref:Uncharacterized protein n=1 Tax=Tetrahymena thermophila (strain SB210) TaxID=312017 RepID=Q24CQ3_TETTS|nr:hypothetical protein TTHERM_01354250 [Tetrahymena thermophila SB210]EAS05556.1 hypothetical protein TTHERM_01354250 [Tetrahymena thermophila SB210]|eukprot:XP_001025801.1 hypothetical protein TTHERM_01354250 [Tetrahymena thermophila SB210]
MKIINLKYMKQLIFIQNKLKQTIINQNKISEKDLNEKIKDLSQKINKLVNTISFSNITAQELRSQDELNNTKTETKCDPAFEEDITNLNENYLTETDEIQTDCSSQNTQSHSLQQKNLILQNKHQYIQTKKSVSFYQDLGKYYEQKESNTKSKENIQIQIKKVQSDPGFECKMQKLQIETIPKKSILKKSKTLEKPNYGQEFYNDLNFLELDFDFYRVKDNQFILNLLQKEQKDQKYSYNAYFSEQAVKLSNSGESQQRIICLTQNYFYVLPNLNSSSDVKRFLIAEINEIILDTNDSEICSLVIKNQFKLNIKLNHRQEFIQFILNVFKKLINALPPIIYFKNCNHFLNSQHRKIADQQQLNNSLYK